VTSAAFLNTRVQFAGAAHEIIEDKVVNFGCGTNRLGSYCVGGAPTMELSPADPTQPARTINEWVLRNGRTAGVGRAKRLAQTLAEGYGD
jgi:hypothetical protein